MKIRDKHTKGSKSGNLSNCLVHQKFDCLYTKMLVKPKVVASDLCMPSVPIAPRNRIWILSGSHCLTTLSVFVLFFGTALSWLKSQHLRQACNNTCKTSDWFHTWKAPRRSGCQISYHLKPSQCSNRKARCFKASAVTEVPPGQSWNTCWLHIKDAKCERKQRTNSLCGSRALAVLQIGYNSTSLRSPDGCSDRKEEEWDASIYWVEVFWIFWNVWVAEKMWNVLESSLALLMSTPILRED